MICMTITFTVVPDHEQTATELMKKLVHHARTESGILQAQVYRSQREQYHFFVYLQFADKSAADTHTSSAYYGEYMMTKLYRMLERDGPVIEIYEPLFEAAQ